MNNIESLIKIYTHQLDEKQRALAVCYDQQKTLLEYREKVEHESKTEQDFLINNHDAINISYQGYCKRIANHQQTIDRSLSDLDKKIRLILDEIGELFIEVKKYEVLDKKHYNEIKKKHLQKEIKDLDYIALSNYMRDHNGNI